MDSILLISVPSGLAAIPGIDLVGLALMAMLLFALVALAGAGVISAVWLASPAASTFLYDRLTPSRQKMRDQVLEELDDYIQDYLRELNRKRPIEIELYP